MALDNVLKIYDEQGNPVNYDILASDVKFQDGKDLPTKLGELEGEIGEGGYAPPAGGIPKTDLSSDVQTSLGKADTAYQKPASGIPATDIASDVIPEKVSDLTNDLGFQTQAQVAAAISQAAIEAIVGNGDFAMTYDENTDTYNIVRLVPALTVTTLAAMSESTKSGTFKVSGVNLKGDVTISTSATGWTLQTGGGSAAQSITLSPTDGVLEETTITVTYSGSTDSTGNTITISSTGAESKTVTATYTEHAGPTITTSNAGISISEVGGYQNTATLQITGVMLTGNITAALSGTNASKFSLSKSTFTQSDGTVNDTLTITYSPAASDTGTHSATLTLSSTDATSVTISLTGTVLTQSLSVSPSTLSFSSQASTESSAQTLTVTGTNLKNDVTVTVPTGFTAKVGGNTVSSLAKEDVMASGGVTISVTALGTAASGSLAFASTTLASTTLSQNVSLGWTQAEADPQVNDLKTIDGLKYKVTTVASGTTPGAVKLINDKGDGGWTAPTYSGAITIPDYVTIANKQYNVTAIGANCFYNAQSVTAISIGANVASIGSYAFFKTGISTIDLPSAISAFPNNLCQNCSSLNSLTIRYSGGVVAYGNSALSGTAINGGTVYVPASILSDYTEPDYNTNPTAYNNANTWKSQNSGFTVTFAAIPEN